VVVLIAASFRSYRTEKIPGSLSARLQLVDAGEVVRPVTARRGRKLSTEACVL